MEGQCHGEMSSLMQEMDSTVKHRVYSDNYANMKLDGRYFWDLDMRLMTVFTVSGSVLLQSEALSRSDSISLPAPVTELRYEHKCSPA